MTAPDFNSRVTHLGTPRSWVISNIRRPLGWLPLTLLGVLLVVYYDVVKPESQSIRTHQQDRVTRATERMKAFTRVHHLHVLPEEKAENWIVVTTKNSPTESIKALAALYPKWKTVVVGDMNTPEDWSWPNCTFLGLDEQEKLGYRILKHLPYEHYSRKNVGYLYAVSHGAQLVYETVDDNILRFGDLKTFQELHGFTSMDTLVTDGISFNAYHLFGQPTAWPKGYPLELVGAEEKYKLMKKPIIPAIQQGLTNLDPDVDAILRLTRKAYKAPNEINFKDRDPVALPHMVFCPFNSHNTFFQFEALWALLLPVTTTSRVSDIWRSYFSQRLLADIDMNLVFTKASAVHDSSGHDPAKDFKEEEKSYESSMGLLEALTDWKAPQNTDLPDRMIILGQLLADKGYWETSDVELLKDWVYDLMEAGYVFPLPGYRVMISDDRNGTASVATEDSMAEGNTAGGHATLPDDVQAEDHLPLKSWDLYEEDLMNYGFMVKDGLSLRNLPTLRLGSIPFMHLASHEGNADLNNFLYEFNDGREQALMDMEGAGCLHRMFMIGERPGAPEFSIYLDGQKVIGGNAKDVFSGGYKGMYPSPFYKYHEDHTGMDSAFPFCFNESILVTASWGKHNFLQEGSDCIRDDRHCNVNFYFNLHGERLMSFPEKVKDTDALIPPKPQDLPSWDDYFLPASVEQRLKSTPSIRQEELNLLLSGKKVTSVLETEGEGVIKSILIKVPNSGWGELSWEMLWDDATEPQVEISFQKAYLGWNLGDQAITAYYAGAWEDKGVVFAYLHYPMPFSKKAIIRVRNAGGEDVPVDITMMRLETNEYFPGTFGYFHAKSVIKPWGSCYTPLLKLEDQAGQLVGLSFRLDGKVLQWVENDPVLYVDGRKQPNMWFTGLEDEIGGGHHFHFTHYYNGPFYGWTNTRPNTIHGYLSSFADKRRFMNRLEYGIQGHNRDPSEPNKHLDYSFMWYARPRPFLILTDEVTFEDTGSLTSHNYQPDPQPSLTTLKAAFNGQWSLYTSGARDFSATTTRHDCPEHKNIEESRQGSIIEEGTVSLTVSIAPTNHGVILRRVIDLFYTPQRAKVYVDNEYVGVWKDADHAVEYAPQRFGESEFIIPPDFTGGKILINLKFEVDRGEQRPQRRDLRHMKGFAWTAFHYFVFTIAP